MSPVLATEDLLAAGRPVPSWIAGDWVEEAHHTIDVLEPATGRALGRISYGGAAEAVEAADAAERAFPDWAARPARVRSDVLAATAARLTDRAGAIGRILAAETGKRLPEAVGEVRFAAEYFRWFAEEIRRPGGLVLTPEDTRRHQYTLRRPAGVAFCLTPWNFPVSIQARKLAPALGAGCTVVARASEKAPLAVLEVFRALEDSGLPAGVANVVNGPAAEQSAAVLGHRAVRVVSFTGSTAVGSRLMTQAAGRIVRCAFELGGDAPFLVFADADLDAAVDGLLVAKFRNNGQSCIGANRVLVERSVLGPFTERLAAATSRLRTGNPLDDPVPDLGPLIDKERCDAVEALVSEAIDGGAAWLGPKSKLPPGSCYQQPGFLVDVPPACGLAATEVFGPVAGIFAFDTEDEAVGVANATEMGLAGYAYTRDASRQWRLGERLDVGILGINHPLPAAAFAPMGGVKQSGIGREGGHQGLEEFSVTRYVSVDE